MEIIFSFCASRCKNSPRPGTAPRPGAKCPAARYRSTARWLGTTDLQNTDCECSIYTFYDTESQRDSVTSVLLGSLSCQSKTTPSTQNGGGAFPLNYAAESPTMWLLGSVLFLVLPGSFGSGTSDLNITAEPEGNATLKCEDAKITEKPVFEWVRTDLEGKKSVLFYRDGKVDPENQHESYKNRVFLKDSQMKDGDLSVVLENLKPEDSGTYQCRVGKTRTKRSILKTPPISTIHLSVVPPGDPSPGDKGGRVGDQEGNEDGGRSHGGPIGIVLAVVLVPAVGLWIYRKKKGSNQSSSGSNKQQNPEEDCLNSDP